MLTRVAAVVCWLQLYVQGLQRWSVWDRWGGDASTVKKKQLITLADHVIQSHSTKPEKENKQILTALDLLVKWSVPPPQYLDEHVKNGENLECNCVRFSPRRAEVLKYWMKIIMTTPPFSPCCECSVFFIPRNVFRAVSGYFTDRKDDTRTYCNYVQR